MEIFIYFAKTCDVSLFFLVFMLAVLEFVAHYVFWENKISLALSICLSADPHSSFRSAVFAQQSLTESEGDRMPSVMQFFFPDLLFLVYFYLTVILPCS